LFEGHRLDPPGVTNSHRKLLLDVAVIEEWMNWNFDEYDLESRKISWFETRKERRWVGNI